MKMYFFNFLPEDGFLCMFAISKRLSIEWWGLYHWIELLIFFFYLTWFFKIDPRKPAQCCKTCKLIGEESLNSRFTLRSHWPVSKMTPGYKSIWCQKSEHIMGLVEGWGTLRLTAKVNLGLHRPSRGGYLPPPKWQKWPKWPKWPFSP